MWQRLTVELVYPLHGAVGRHHYERHMLIVSLSHSRSKIKKSRTRCYTHHGRALSCLGYAQSIESSRTLIRNGMTFYRLALTKIVYNRRVATARAHHGIAHAILQKQGCQYVDILFIAEHDRVKV